MKKLFFFSFLTILMLQANNTIGQKASSGQTATLQTSTFGGAPITVAHANEYIKAYLSSSSTTSTRSLFIEADTLRKFLSNGNIRAIKFFFARPATGSGSDTTALTLIVAGVNNQNQIVLNSEGAVYEELRPCPTECPPGEAGDDLLPENQKK